MNERGFLCRRCGLWCPCEAKNGKAALAEAKHLGWQWMEDGWLCPDHRETIGHTALLFFVTVMLSFAALAFRSLALSWCWNHVAPTLWPTAPHVQAWQVFALLMFQPFSAAIKKRGRKSNSAQTILRLQRERVTAHAIMTALSWVAIAAIVKVFVP